MTTQCPNCAAGIVEEAQVCDRCGAAVAVPAQSEMAMPEPPAPFVPSFLIFNELEGLGGWLILTGIGLAVAPLLYLYRILLLEAPVVFGGRYQGFLNEHRELSGLILIEMITHTLFLAATVALLYLFFNKRRSFPAAMIVYLASQAIFVIIDHYAAASLLPSGFEPRSVFPILQGVLASAVWIPYFLNSQRVKFTFVR
jgi:hypothetical protein